MKVTITLAATVLPLAAVAGSIFAARDNINGCVPLGCYTDSVDARALDLNTQVANGPTDQSPEACTAACIAEELDFAGVEFGSECWCGAIISNGQTLAADQSLCSMPCTGAADEICGGAGGINIFDCSTQPTSSTTPPTSPLYGQCGGIGWTGPTTCASSTCTVINVWYSQCL